ncbi:coproporphyrinogen dehydrogenase HemZ [Fusibacter paucivorans]|uniref:Coproporphyrinogen dehydrogenase HemZ n=1 Tax=Fusibacter paucivorans TaxID=76009 RepID=A0ABS5PS91_9FIRM|nr:coproporphyrinogen dehydrogenase HemZ [Fusibacter paucivorans]MBS7527737.1 coproporphyrinogen dehydrogenase HemZ [Fusibacter paucivorans]
MLVYVERNELYYDLENLIAIFIQKSQLSFLTDEHAFEEAVLRGEACLKLQQTPELFTAVYYKDGTAVDDVKITLSGEGSMTPEVKRSIKKRFYQLLESHYTPKSKWGILVGIRPVKIVHELLDRGLAPEAIRKQLSEDYLIQNEKIDLMMAIAARERPHLFPVDSDKLSLYICIPFCPTRCLYCSFPSNDVRKKGALMTPYVTKLIEEIRETAKYAANIGKTVDCIYIGGGTPTSLNAEQLTQLLKAVSEAFDLTSVLEFTVEAGRPDTVDLEKLRIMKKYGVDRVCVNPQTMNDSTLVKIGRMHKASAITDMMQQVRQVGFKVVNMDLIMGLPDETVADAEKTVEALLAMAPENVTLHTLAVKRASRLNEHLETIALAHDDDVSNMMATADRMLRRTGLTPYYMYRQKKMIGHLENVGYAANGCESLYNMRIMEERHTIIALGAGAVSKICHPSENRFERVANFKGVEDYLNRFDEILLKKASAFSELTMQIK